MIINILDYYVLQNMSYFNILNIFILKKIIICLYRSNSYDILSYKIYFWIGIYINLQYFFKPSLITPCLSLKESCNTT